MRHSFIIVLYIYQWLSSEIPPNAPNLWLQVYDMIIIYDTLLKAYNSP